MENFRKHLQKGQVCLISFHCKSLPIHSINQPAPPFLVGSSKVFVLNQPRISSDKRVVCLFTLYRAGPGMTNTAKYILP